jgi:hypothetical protein
MRLQLRFVLACTVFLVTWTSITFVSNSADEAEAVDVTVRP